MLSYPNIDPVAISLGPLKVHWYGLMYLIGFAGGWWLGRVRARRPGTVMTHAQVDDFVFYVALGVVLGGRIGYILFYNFSSFISEPWILFKVWQGGMSFHGGLLGVLTAVWLYARKLQVRYFAVVDFVAPLVTIGLGTGRLGNFINGELWGKVTELPWGMVFPGAGPLPRHPTQLYEFLLEGVLLLTILWIYSNRPRPVMAVSGMFALCYATFRFVVEFVREPDAHIGYLAFDWLTMGQILSLPLFLVGVVLMYLAKRKGCA
ncbi:MAG: prolipoprotein diacylglyceryl transferase [Thiohalomonadaceae bacterium]